MTDLRDTPVSAFGVVCKRCQASQQAHLGVLGLRSGGGSHRQDPPPLSWHTRAGELAVRLCRTVFGLRRCGHPEVVLRLSLALEVVWSPLLEA